MMKKISALWLDVSPLKKYPDFRKLFAGQFVSTLGSMMTYLAVPYQVYQLTNSSFAVGMLSLTQLLPLLIFALWGGAIADAMDRRKLILGSELFLALCALTMMINAFFARPSVALIFFVSALMSAATGFHRPALDSLSPRLVNREDLTAVSVLGSLRFSICAIAGPALGGIGIARFGVAITYLIDAASFFFSILMIYKIRRIPPQDVAPSPGLKSILEGLHYARKRQDLMGTYIVDLVAMTFAMPMALFPAMAQAWGGPAAAGWLFAAMPMGSLLVSAFSGWSSRVRRHGAAVILAAAAWGVAVIALGFAPGLAMAVICLAAAGAADMVSGIFRSTIWNETIPSHLRGRLAGIEMISYMSGPLLGNARAGWVAALGTPRFSIWSGGTLCTVGVLACILIFPKFWSYASTVSRSDRS